VDGVGTDEAEDFGSAVVDVGGCESKGCVTTYDGNPEALFDAFLHQVKDGCIASPQNT